MKKKNELPEELVQRLNFNFGDAWKSNPAIYIACLERNKTVRQCDNCGKDMTKSEVDDYGSLCERCYMREYY